MGRIDTGGWPTAARRLDTQRRKTLNGEDEHFRESLHFVCMNTGSGGRTLNGDDGHLIGRIETLKGWTLSWEDGHFIGRKETEWEDGHLIGRMETLRGRTSGEEDGHWMRTMDTWAGREDTGREGRTLGGKGGH